MRIKSNTVLFAPAAVFVFAVSIFAYPVHTFHTSLMQVEYNDSEQLVEISLQVFTHDLENILSRRSGNNVRLDKTPNASQLALAYLNESINLKNRDGKVKSLSWVGMEPEADAVWIYVETKMPEGLEGEEIRNRLFFQLFDDQINLVHIKYDGKKCDLVFKPGDDFKLITPTNREGT